MSGMPRAARAVVALLSLVLAMPAIATAKEAAALWMPPASQIPSQQYDAEWKESMKLGPAFLKQGDRVFYPVVLTGHPSFGRAGCAGFNHPSNNRIIMALRVPLASIDPHQGTEQFTNADELIAIAERYCSSVYGQPFNIKELEVTIFTADVRSPLPQPASRPKGIRSYRFLVQNRANWDRYNDLRPAYASFGSNPQMLVDLSRKQRNDLDGAVLDYWKDFHARDVQGQIDICNTRFDAPPRSIQFEGQSLPFRQPAVICELAKRLKIVGERLNDCGQRSTCALAAPANRNYLDQAYRPSMVLVTANLGEYLRLLLEREQDKERVFQSFLGFFNPQSPYHIFEHGGGIAPDNPRFNGQSEEAVHQRFRYYNSAAHLVLSQQYQDARLEHYIAAEVLPKPSRWKWPIDRKYLKAKAAYDQQMRASERKRPQSVASCAPRQRGRQSLECRAIDTLQGWTDDRVYADFVAGTHTFQAPREARVTYRATEPTAANGRMIYSSYSGMESRERLNYTHIVNGMISAKQARMRKQQDGLVPIAGAFLAGMAAYVFLGAPDQNAAPKWTPDTKMHTFGYSANDLLVKNPF